VEKLGKLVPPLPANVEYNYAYMPIEVDDDIYGLGHDKLYEELKKYNALTRRYFYPRLCDFPCYSAVTIKDSLSVARSVASRILTLPIYYDLALDDVQRICDIIIAIGSK